MCWALNEKPRMGGNIFYHQISVWRWKQTTFTPLLPVICAHVAAEMSHSPQIERLCPHINIKFLDSGPKVSAFFLFATFESPGRSNKKALRLANIPATLSPGTRWNHRTWWIKEWAGHDLLKRCRLSCFFPGRTWVPHGLWTSRPRKAAQNKARGRYRVSFIFSVFLLWIEPIISSLYLYGGTHCPEIKLHLLWPAAWALLSS